MLTNQQIEEKILIQESDSENTKTPMFRINDDSSSSKLPNKNKFKGITKGNIENFG